MSYEPKLIIRKSDLMNHIELLEDEIYSNNKDIRKIAEYLLNVSKRESVKFTEIELIICQPEFSYFNSMIREKLDELNVEYKIDN